MKAFIIATAIIVVLLGVAYFSGWWPWSRTSPALVPAPAPAPVPVPTPTPTPIPGPATSPSVVPSPVPSPSPSPEGGVGFSFAITDISGSGFSRTITAQISNTGQADAHNVWARVEVFSGGSRVRIGGQDDLRVDIGVLKAGQTVERQVAISFSLTDGLKISQNGATVSLTLHSDEYTEAFSYDYSP